MPSNISIHDTIFDLRTPGTTPAGSRHTSVTSMKGQAAEGGRSRLASMVSWSGGPPSEPEEIDASRITDLILRRIGPKDLAVYNKYTFYQARPKSGYVEIDLSLAKSLPASASQFVVDFTIKRSTGDVKRSISLAHCRIPYRDKDILAVLQRCQLKLSNASQIKMPAGVKLDNINFSFGLQQSHAFEALLTVEEKTVDPGQTVDKAYISEIIFKQSSYGPLYLDNMRVQGRTAQLGIKDIEYRALSDSINLTAMDSKTTKLLEMSESDRSVWLGGKKMRGNCEVYKNWIIRDLKFSYSGAVVGGRVECLRPAQIASVPAIRPQEAAPAKKKKKEKEKKKHGLW